MMLDVIFGGLVRVAHGELRMTMRDEGLMRRMGMIVFFVMPRGFAVVPRGAFVMIGRGKVVLSAREQFRHGVSNAILGEWELTRRSARLSLINIGDWRLFYYLNNRENISPSILDVSARLKVVLDHGYKEFHWIICPIIDFIGANSHILAMATKTKQWPRKAYSNSNWHHLSATEFDNGERWSIVWDTQRRPGVDGRSTALEKLEHGALERARHILRMGFIVYEIRQPSGSVFLEEAGVRQRLGLQAAT
jgi:hypothetical protein